MTTLAPVDVYAAQPPPVIDLSAAVIAFSDQVADTATTLAAQRRYFRYLSLDADDSTRIYVGAVNHVYILNASNISQKPVKSADLSEVVGARVTIQNNFGNCLARGKDIEFTCQNHVRSVIRMKDDLFVCTTGSSSPIIYHLNVNSLEVKSVDLKGGRAKCPYDPSSNYTIVYVERGNPGGVGAVYTGTATDFTNSDPVIYRPPLSVLQPSGVTAEYRLLRTEQDTRWLNDPHFVGSFDIGEYVYFFFREHALEHAYCGRVVYSRVARVCKSDEGGSSLSMDYRWTTFLKARLNCSQPGETTPFYFDEIYDIQYNKTLKIFYGLFRTVHNGFWGSAVCMFSLSSIDEVFSHSPFKGQRTVESGWRPVSDRDVPSPRPGHCRHRSLDVATSTLAFIKSHPLLHDTVDSLGGRPIYYTKDDQAVSRLAVMHVGKYTVLFIGSNRGVIYKVAHWRSNAGKSRDVTVAVLRPFGDVIRPISQMVLHSSVAHPASATSVTPYLYLGTDDAVVQLRVDDCSQYTKCLTCARDPNCGWDIKQHTCRPFQSTSGMIQKVSAADDACNRRCSVRLQSPKQLMSKVQVVHGAPLHLNCTTLPPGCATDHSTSVVVTWHFSEPNGAFRTLQLDGDPAGGAGFILTQDYGLVILSTRTDLHSGTYTCSLDGVPVIRHEVLVLPCRLRLDREETWKQEFASWCSAFYAYTQEFNKWMCFKKQCIKEKCIPQSVIEKCNHHSP
jgi:semaphorin 6